MSQVQLNTISECVIMFRQIKLCDFCCYKEGLEKFVVALKVITAIVVFYKF